MVREGAGGQSPTPGILHLFGPPGAPTGLFQGQPSSVQQPSSIGCGRTDVTLPSGGRRPSLCSVAHRCGNCRHQAISSKPSCPFCELCGLWQEASVKTRENGGPGGAGTTALTSSSPRDLGVCRRWVLPGVGSALFPGRVRFRTRGYTTGRGGEVSMGSPRALAVQSPTQGGCPGQMGVLGCSLLGPGHVGDPVWTRAPPEPAGLHPPARRTMVRAWERLPGSMRPHQVTLGTSPNFYAPWGKNRCAGWPLRWNPTIQSPPNPNPPCC